jgi:Uma2 family endonuclease
MTAFQQDLCLSEEQYLKSEQLSNQRHEFLAGRLFAMVGASRGHNLIVSNLHRHVYDPVKAGGCNAFISDMKVRVEAMESYYYPDLVVSCEASAPASVFLSLPCLIVEVLSPSTMDVDRREKMLAYRKISSLKEYVLVYQDEIRIEVYRKDADGNWHCQSHSGGSSVQLNPTDTIMIDLDMESVYKDTGVAAQNV